MRKKFFVIAMLTLVANVALAGEIDEARARAIATEFINGNAVMRQRSAALPVTLSLAEANEGYYAFNRGTDAGFVIVSADDAAAVSVLGYADEGTFDPQSMPDALTWLLSEYSRELAAAKTLGATEMLTRASEERSDIAPMLTSIWGQDEPFNELCPTLNGTACPTGCVATALAQIMYYHRWPATGTGTVSYEWASGGQTITADLSQSTYDWDAMQDSYLNGYSDEAATAVAQLCYDIGVASEMDYAPAGSGASTGMGGVACIENFGYASDMQWLTRDYYGSEEWTSLIYDELAAGRPVFYSGQSGSGGHAFVFDGYRDGYFHVDWGWEGSANGYFVLTALDPAVQGVGGSLAGYNYQQSAFIGMKPSEGDEEKAEPLLYCIDDFTTSSTTVSVFSPVTFSGGFYSYSLGSVDAMIGLMVVSEDGDTTYVETGYSAKLAMGYGYSQIVASMMDFPGEDGTYTVYPAYRDNSTGKWYQMRTNVSSSSRYLIATVESGFYVTFSSPTTQTPTLSVTNLAPASTAYTGNYFLVNATVTNNGDEFYDQLYVCLLSSGTYNVAGSSTYRVVSLAPGESADLTFETLAPSTAGTYDLVLAWSNYVISSREEVTVQSASTGSLSFALTEPLTVTKSPSEDDNTICLTANVTCLQGVYGGKAMAYVFPGDGGYSLTAYTTDLYVGTGESQQLTFEGTFEVGTPGERYYAMLYYINSSGSYTVFSNGSSNYAYFTYAASTGIEAASAASGEPRDIDIYTLTGTLVARQRGTAADLSALPAGIYVVKDGDTVRKVAKK